MLHRQRALYALPIWLGNRILLALVSINDVQNLKLVAFYKITLSTSFVWYEDKKAVQVNMQKASHRCAACAQNN